MRRDLRFGGTKISGPLTSSLDDFRSAFEGLGYRPLSGVTPQSRRDIWYRHESSSDEADHLALLQYKPTAKSYGVRLAVRNIAAQHLFKQALPVILPYLHPTFASNAAKFFDRPHWLLFDAGRAFDWPLLAVPNPLARLSWAVQLEELRKRLLQPIFWNVRTIRDIESMLFRDDTPFEWSVSGPVIRAAEIVTLAKVAKLQMPTTRKRLMEFEDVITLGMHGSDDCAAMLNAFLERI